MLLVTSLSILVENFRRGRNKSVNEAFRISSVVSQFHADATIDDVTPRFLKGPSSDDGDGSTIGEDVVVPPADILLVEQ